MRSSPLFLPISMGIVRGTTSMTDLVIALSPEVKDRLEAVAAKLGKTLDQSLQQAVEEFLEHWEDYLTSVDHLTDEERVSLHVPPEE